jgi:nucleoside-diphosphate-sugar epimerase
VKENVMRVLVVGAIGAVGRPLLPRLAEAGHEVIATARHVRRRAACEFWSRPLDLLEASP